MKNWKTNLGGAISVTGTTLLGVGILPQLSQLSPSASGALTPHQLTALWYVALVGFVLSGLGKGFTALFAADAAAVVTVAKEVDRINALGSDPNSAKIVPQVPVVPNPPISAPADSSPKV